MSDQTPTIEELNEELKALEKRRARLLELLKIEAENTSAYLVRDFIALDDGECFDTRFNELLRKHETGQQAYFAVESEHCIAYGRNKYSGYNSYKAARSRRMNKDC